MLNYLKETIQRGEEIERPTAREYWRLFAELHHPQFDGVGIDIIRNKSINLRRQYFRANEWKISAVQQIDDPERLENELTRLCRNYYLLHEIYSTTIDEYTQNKTNRPTVPFKRTDDPFRSLSQNYSNQSHTDSQDPFEDDFYSEIVKAEPIVHDTQTIQHQEEPSNEFVIEDSLTIASVLNKSVVSLIDVLKQNISIQTRRLKIEEDKFIHQKSINERQLELEIKRQEIEVRFRELELNQNRELKKMDIEKELKIARMEMELKYGKQIEEV